MLLVLRKWAKSADRKTG